MSVEDDLKKLFAKMPEAFIPERAAGLVATIQLNLSGEGGGDWVLDVKDGQLSVREGQAQSPDLTLGMEARDYVALSRGEANPMNLFATGKIKLEGNINLALKFQEMFAQN